MGTGTQTAAFITTGLQEASGYTMLNSTETFNGSVWSYATNYPYPNNGYGTAFGTVTAALAAIETYVYSYNGTSWTSAASPSTPRHGAASTGILSAGIISGGVSPSYAHLTSAELFNGSTWSSGGTMVNGRSQHGGSGASGAAAIAHGGQDSSYNMVASTEKYS